MKFEIKGQSNEDVAVVELKKDGQDVDIKVNGQLVAWFHPATKELIVNISFLEAVDLSLKEDE